MISRMATLTNHKLKQWWLQLDHTCTGTAIKTKRKTIRSSWNVQLSSFRNAHTCELSGYHEQINVVVYGFQPIPPECNTYMLFHKSEKGFWGFLHDGFQKFFSDIHVESSKQTFIEITSVPQLSKRALFSIMKSRDPPSSSSLPPKRNYLIYAKTTFTFKVKLY